MLLLTMTKKLTIKIVSIVAAATLILGTIVGVTSKSSNKSGNTHKNPIPSTNGPASTTGGNNSKSTEVPSKDSNPIPDNKSSLITSIPTIDDNNSKLTRELDNISSISISPETIYANNSFMDIDTKLPTERFEDLQPSQANNATDEQQATNDNGSSTSDSSSDSSNKESSTNTPESTIVDLPADGVPFQTTPISINNNNYTPASEITNGNSDITSIDTANGTASGDENGVGMIDSSKKKSDNNDLSDTQEPSAALGSTAPVTTKNTNDVDNNVSSTEGLSEDNNALLAKTEENEQESELSDLTTQNIENGNSSPSVNQSPSPIATSNNLIDGSNDSSESSSDIGNLEEKLDNYTPTPSNKTDSKNLDNVSLSDMLIGTGSEESSELVPTSIHENTPSENHDALPDSPISTSSSDDDVNDLSNKPTEELDTQNNISQVKSDESAHNGLPNNEDLNNSNAPSSSLKPNGSTTTPPSPVISDGANRITEEDKDDIEPNLSSSNLMKLSHELSETDLNTILETSNHKSNYNDDNSYSKKEAILTNSSSKDKAESSSTVVGIQFSKPSNNVDESVDPQKAFQQKYNQAINELNKSLPSLISKLKFEADGFETLQEDNKEVQNSINRINKKINILNINQQVIDNNIGSLSTKLDNLKDEYKSKMSEYVSTSSSKTSNELWKLETEIMNLNLKISYLEHVRESVNNQIGTLENNLKNERKRLDLSYLQRFYDNNNKILEQIKSLFDNISNKQEYLAIKTSSNFMDYQHNNYMEYYNKNKDLKRNIETEEKNITSKGDTYQPNEEFHGINLGQRGLSLTSFEMSTLQNTFNDYIEENLGNNPLTQNIKFQKPDKLYSFQQHIQNGFNLTYKGINHMIQEVEEHLHSKSITMDNKSNLEEQKELLKKASKAMYQTIKYFNQVYNNVANPKPDDSSYSDSSDSSYSSYDETSSSIYTYDDTDDSSDVV